MGLQDSITSAKHKMCLLSIADRCKDVSPETEYVTASTHCYQSNLPALPGDLSSSEQNELLDMMIRYVM